MSFPPIYRKFKIEDFYRWAIPCECAVVGACVRRVPDWKFEQKSLAGLLELVAAVAGLLVHT